MVYLNIINMEESKILKVLEKVPSDTKLYSTAFGNLELESIVEGFAYKRIKLMEENGDRRIYLPDGRYKKGGEVTLYPSKEMRDWDKFAWKKGDVLTNNKGAFCIFKEFSGYPYTNFVAIFVHILHGYLYYAAIGGVEKLCISTGNTWCGKNEVVRYATEKEKTKLFDALTKEGKRWNAEKKVIEDVKPMHKKESDKPEHEFKPFEEEK